MISCSESITVPGSWYWWCISTALELRASSCSSLMLISMLAFYYLVILLHVCKIWISAYVNFKTTKYHKHSPYMLQGIDAVRKTLGNSDRPSPIKWAVRIESLKVSKSLITNPACWPWLPLLIKLEIFYGTEVCFVCAFKFHYERNAPCPALSHSPPRPCVCIQPFCLLV